MIHRKMADVSKNFPVMLLGTRFTNTISCFEPGPQEHYMDIFGKTLKTHSNL
jgi:hypothetical protein